MTERPDRCELHHEDETHPETNPDLTRDWHRKGTQPTIAAAGTNRRATDFGSKDSVPRAERRTNLPTPA